MYEDVMEAKLHVFNGNSADVFYLWELRVKAVRQGNNLILALTDDNLDRKVTEKSSQ